jgi:hypothetical protein
MVHHSEGLGLEGDSRCLARRTDTGWPAWMRSSWARNFDFIIKRAQRGDKGRSRVLRGKLAEIGMIG